MADEKSKPTENQQMVPINQVLQLLEQLNRQLLNLTKNTPSNIIISCTTKDSPASETTKQKNPQSSPQPQPQNNISVNFTQKRPPNSSGWILDSGATDHMTYDPSDIKTHSLTTKTYIQTTDGNLVTIQSSGLAHATPKMPLKNCLLIPKLSHKLLSVSKLTKDLNCTVLMSSTGCVVQDTQTGTIIGRGTEYGGLYYINEESQQGRAILAHGSDEQRMWMWHRRLGHPSLGYLKRLFPSLSVSKNSLECESCVLAKSHKHSYLPSTKHAAKPFALVHSDVWGPSPEFATHDYSYFILFIDDCTRLSWLYLMKHKSEVFDVFIKFYNMVLTQFNTKIQILRSDNGGEYLSKKIGSFISQNGLIHQTTCSDTPQQNGVAERKIEHFLK